MKAEGRQNHSRSVYLLQHVVREGSNDEDVKTLGIFSSQRQASAAIQRFKKLAGFKQYPNGFHVDQYRLNQHAWTEGFASIRSLPMETTERRKRRA